MALQSRTLWVVTSVNVAAACVTLMCCAYLTGLRDAQSNNPEAPSPPLGTTDVRPNPAVGHGGHPTFDCTTMTTKVNRSKNTHVTIRALATQSESRSNKPVTVKAMVVNAFPNIMGVNWFHLCERPGGEVLVVSGTEWSAPGTEVIVRGILSVNRNVGGAYLFPLYIEGADLEGPHVKSSTDAVPKPTYFL
jgi:hypothetical protein